MTAELDPNRPVYKQRSRKVGNLHVPEPLIERMRASTCDQHQRHT